MEGYPYIVRLDPTAQTAAKTLIQVKAGNAALCILSAKIYQITSTASQLLRVEILRKTAAATVTSFTPLKLGPNDPASLAVGGTAATGTNASAEGTNGDVLEQDMWNVINGSWSYLPVPEDRIWVTNGGIIALVLQTAPAASMTIGAFVRFMDMQ